jgi:hypothetical protein
VIMQDRQSTTLDDSSVAVLIHPNQPDDRVTASRVGVRSELAHLALVRPVCLALDQVVLDTTPREHGFNSLLCSSLDLNAAKLHGRTIAQTIPAATQYQCYQQNRFALADRATHVPHRTDTHGPERTTTVTAIPPLN